MDSPPPLPRRAFLRQSSALAATACLTPTFAASPESPGPVRIDWQDAPDRPWTGREVWANPLQDWRVADGRAECVHPAPDRTLHLLTRQVGRAPGTLELAVRIGRRGGAPLAGRGSAGFRVGILGTLRDHPEHHDYRNNLWAPATSGFNAGFSADGRLFLGRPGHGPSSRLDLARESVELRLRIIPAGDANEAVLTAHAPADGRELARVALAGVAHAALVGNLALVSNFPGPGEVAAAKGKGKKAKAAEGAAGGPGTGEFWFAGWSVGGTRLTGSDTQHFGPVLWTQYTLSGRVLKLSAQFPPLGAADTDTARLEIATGGRWRPVAEARIDPAARLALFRLPDWDDARDVAYRVAYSLRDARGRSTDHHWEGVIRRDPVDQEVLTVADVSCNIHSIFPNTPLVRSTAQLKPDLLAFVGDQFYESTGGFGVQRAPLEPAIIDYLRKWYFHGWTWRELMRDRPSLSLPDDHDVYQGNLWGEGGEGRKTTQEAGGYDMPAEWVNVVHRTQTAHHPDPYDPMPSRRGTLNYYGAMTYGRVSFAVLADRQFKSGPEGKVPPTGSARGDHVKNPAFDPRTADVPGLSLLGDRQEQFIREWVADWRGADLKAVISQTIFTAMATTHGGNREVLIADYDANGWAQSPRNRALRELRKAFPVHLAGDQHLPAVVQYGIDQHRDGPVAFAGPAVNVGYPRWWEPAKTGRNGTTGNPGLTGDFLDHFGSPLTVLAVRNGPETPPADVLAAVEAKTSGLGVARLNKAKRTITFECWPYSADVTREGTQMPLWPVTIHQRDNYARPAAAHLPELRMKGMTDPVVLVHEQASGELVYGLRIRGGNFRPHVFAAGRYRVTVGEPGTPRVVTLEGLEGKVGNPDALDVTL